MTIDFQDLRNQATIQLFATKQSESIMYFMSFRHLLCRTALLSAFVVVLGISIASAYDPYPTKPIKLVVATPPGGTSDVAARIIAEAIRSDLGQPVIVENKVGASGTIGAAFVAKSPPDGYTFFFGTGSTHVIAPAMMKGISYDPIKDFTPVVLVGRAPFVFIAGAAQPARTLPDIIAAARARPGELNFGTTGPAGVYELAALTLEAVADVKFNHVPYKGLAPMALDLAAGRLDVAVGPLDGSVVKNERIRIVASLGKHRIPSLPDVPAAGESGYGDFNVATWAAIYAPAETPRAIVTRVMTAIRIALARRDIQEKIAATGVVAEGGDDATLRRVMAEDLEAARARMRKANVEPQ